MGTLRVDPHGLSAFSASCGLRAVTVRGALGSAGNRGPFFQATSAAVTNSDAMVDAACRTLAERIDDLSSKLSSAVSMYQGRDHESASTLDRTIDGVSS
jgi:hypothetical protein